MRRTSTRIAIGLAGATTAALTGLAAPTATAAPAASGSSWTADGHDAARRFADPAESTITPTTVGNLRKQYTITPTRGSDDACPDILPPLVVGGSVVTSDASGASGGIAAYDAATGTRRWRATFDDYVESPRDLRLAAAGGRVFVADDLCGSYSSPTGDVAAFDAATGERLWHVYTGQQGYDALVVTHGLVVASGDGGADTNADTIAYSAATGRVVWKRTGLHQAIGTLASGLLVLTDRDLNHGVAVDAATGRTRWTRDDVEAAVAGVPGSGTFLARLYVAGERRLGLLRVADGSTVWSVPDPLGQFDFTASAVAVDGSTVHVAGSDGTLVARRLSDGHAVWTRSFPGSVIDDQNPVVAGGVLYLTRVEEGSPSAVLALDADTGTSVGTVAKGVFTGHPVVAGGRVYLVTPRSVRAYSPS